MINQTNRYNTSNAIVHHANYLHAQHAESIRVFAATPQNSHHLHDNDSSDYMFCLVIANKVNYQPLNAIAF